MQHYENKIRIHITQFAFEPFQNFQLRMDNFGAKESANCHENFYNEIYD